MEMSLDAPDTVIFVENGNDAVDIAASEVRIAIFQTRTVVDHLLFVADRTLHSTCEHR